MKILHDGIFEIPLFASEQECSKIVSSVSKAPESVWNVGEGEWEGRILPVWHDPELQNMREKISKRVAALFISFSGIRNPHTTIQRMKGGTGGLGVHRDNFVDTLVTYGLVLYFNEDFEGGEIVYPNAGLTYKPKTGSLLIHEARHEHGVNPVTSGIRYMTTYFVEGDEKIAAKLREDL